MKKGTKIKAKYNSYKILEITGNGGNSSVYKACDSSNEIYAIKFLTSNNLERFEKEKEFQLDNDSSYVTKVVDYGTIDKDGKTMHFYVMEYFDKTFKAIIEDDTMSFYKKINLYLKLCECVRYIHNKKIIHRDIKPENILFDSKTGRICLADFGIAHFPNSELTQSGDRLANFNYAAPEQKEHHGKITKAVDIYSLGLILNQIFTRTIPNGENYKKIKETHPHFASLDQVVSKMIMYNYKDRELNLTKIISEIRLIVRLINEEKSDIEYALDFVGENKNKKEITGIVVEDILYANQLLYTNEDFSKFNISYHSEIFYIPNELLGGTYSLIKIKDMLERKWRNENLHFDSNENNPFQSPLFYENFTNDDCYKIFRSNIINIKCYKELNYLKNEILRLFGQLKSYHAVEFIRSIEKVFENIFEPFTLFEAAILLDKLCRENILERNDISIATTFVVDLNHSSSDVVNIQLYKKSSKEELKKENIEIIEKYFDNLSIIRFGTKDYCFFNNIKSKSQFLNFLENIISAFVNKNDLTKDDYKDLLNKVNTMDEYFEIDDFDIYLISNAINKK